MCLACCSNQYFLRKPVLEDNGSERNTLLIKRVDIFKMASISSLEPIEILEQYMSCLSVSWNTV